MMVLESNAFEENRNTGAIKSEGCECPRLRSANGNKEHQLHGKEKWEST